MTHSARAPDGLDASSDGCKNVKKTRDDWYYQIGSDRQETKVIQSMGTPGGIQKGIKTILTERGKPLKRLWTLCKDGVSFQDRLNGGNLAVSECFRKNQTFSNRKSGYPKRWKSWVTKLYILPQVSL